ncbi:hypothetical protein, partial [Siminovitchia fortis]|uniref:hypothetical protein n=1 Tax=Siminovitchia fortis TaxID=254758 RepID=UPI001C92DC6E
RQQMALFKILKLKHLILSYSARKAQAPCPAPTSTRRILMRQFFSRHSKTADFNHFVRYITEYASCSFATR